jgi:hypothetical protein
LAHAAWHAGSTIGHIGQADAAVADEHHRPARRSREPCLPFRCEDFVVCNVPSGGWRPDVAVAHPGHPDAGFSMAFNYGNLSPGPHAALVRASCVSGGYNDATATFDAGRFQAPFFSEPDACDLAEVSVTHDGSSIHVHHVLIEGVPYDVSLQWRTDFQGFAIVGIAPPGESCDHTSAACSCDHMSGTCDGP